MIYMFELNNRVLLLLGLLLLIYIFSKKDEKFEICDSNGKCRSPEEFMKEENLVAATPENVTRADELKDIRYDSEKVEPLEMDYGNAKLEVNKLDDGLKGKGSLVYSQCSQSCCTPQYPVPFKLKENKNVCKNLNNFVPTSYKCNNSYENSGCVCMTKEQSEYLSSRGGNN